MTKHAEVDSNLRAPYRVAVWGPGTMGKAAIRELLRLPETSLVSVLAYNPQSNGIDVGKLLGTADVGVKVVTDFEAMLAEKPEVIIHTTRNFADFRADDDIIRVLEAGVNIITVLPYQYPTARGKEVNQRFIEAGKKGNATLHGSGIDPGFLYERLAASLTGLSNDIQYIKLQEFIGCVDHPAEILAQLGFGSSLAEMENNVVAATYAGNYLTMGMHFLADKLGLPVERIERTYEPTLAPNDITIANGFAAKRGTVAYLCYTWTGYVKSKPMFIVQVNWYLDDTVRPAAARSPYYWAVEIEGIPSTRMGLEITGSIVENRAITKRTPTSADYLATIIPAIQAIPAVIAAPPGVLEAEMPQFHWKPDMRS